MRHAPLDQAYLELKQKCDRFDIRVPYGKRVVLYKDKATVVRVGTSLAACQKMLKEMVKEAEEEHFKRTQGSLFS